MTATSQLQHASSVPLPPFDGSLLLPEILEYNLTHSATLPFWYFADGPDAPTEITHLEFVRAVHRSAHLFRPGREGREGRVVALLANTDNVLYYTAIMGLIVAGCVPFPISPRNSPAAIVHLLAKTSCHEVLATQVSLRSLVASVQEELAARHDAEPFEVTVKQFPTIDDMYPLLGRETSADAFDGYYPPSKTRPSLSDPAMYIHSSGSTGFPKPIPESHKYLIEMGDFQMIQALHRWPGPLRMGAMALPSFHAYGVIVGLIVPLFSSRAVCLYPPTTKTTGQPIIPTSENILEHIAFTNANMVSIVPSYVEIWVESSSAVEQLKKLDVVIYGGGPLAHAIGQAMVDAGVKLQSMYGGTEFGICTHGTLLDGPCVVEAHRREWDWIKFSDRCTIRWVPLGDGTFELQFLSTEKHTLSVENLPDVRGYSTKDVWEKHPTKPDLFKIVGRLDDVLILASGEKAVPGPMEDIILAHPAVRGAIMFGRERNQVGILIEPASGHEFNTRDETRLAAFRNMIWPFVEKANAGAPTFSRIFKEMILVTTPDRPMIRTPKGTVTRKATLKEYEDDINVLYQTVHNTAHASRDIAPPAGWKAEELAPWILEHCVDIQDGKDVVPDADLFQQGFDSLSATSLRNRLISALREASDPAAKQAASKITQNIIFAHPSVKQLAEYVSTLVNPEQSVSAKGASPAQHIINTMEKYSAGLDANAPLRNDCGNCGAVGVLLTGSTGGLGSWLLSDLLKDPHVSRVYALNRSSTRATVMDRQVAAFKDRQLDCALLNENKLVLLEADTDRDGFGLEKAVYDEMQAKTTIIIHNAWRLDFNLSLASFEPNVKGTRNLVDFALASPHAAHLRFLFTSSIGTTSSWDKSRGPYPEEVQLDPAFAIGNGYGEAKYVTERVLANSGLNACSFRIGQLTGSKHGGAWATTDWVPLLLKSSIALGALPDAQGLSSWLPMDGAAQAILDVAFASDAPPPALNLVNPHMVPWTTIMQNASAALASALNIERLPLVPFSEWAAKLESRAVSATDSDFKDIPSLKMPEFVASLRDGDAWVRKTSSSNAEAAGMTLLSTDKLCAISPTLRNMPQLDFEDVAGWIRYWKAKGLF